MTKNNFNTGKFVASLLMIATLAMVTIPSSYEQSSTAKVLDPSSTTYAECLEKIEQDTHTKYASVNEQSAISSALNYNEFKSMSKNYTYSKGTIVSGC